MNFRSFKYFLTVCEMGTINAAARKLYISQQSLSQHIKKMETEVGAQLFHRDNPLVLTEAGKCVYRAAKTVMETLDRMEQEVADCSGAKAVELTIGMIDYGTPDFFAPLAELFIKKEPQVLILTRELYSGDPIPADVPLFLSPRELGGNYRSELLFCDRLVVCVADSLLKKRYPDWRQRKERLRRGDISALEGCPFLRHVNTPLQDITERAFQQNHFQPYYLPVMGKVSTMSRLCADGQAAMTSLQNAMKHIENLPGYLVSNVPDQIPASQVISAMKKILCCPVRQPASWTSPAITSNEKKHNFACKIRPLSLDSGPLFSTWTHHIQVFTCRIKHFMCLCPALEASMIELESGKKTVRICINCT